VSWQKMKASNCPEAEVHAEFRYARLPSSRKSGVTALSLICPSINQICLAIAKAIYCYEKAS
jgi:hypothetical protein